MVKHSVSSAATLIAIALAGPALAEPAVPDLWIGLADSDDGFLIDEDTGAVWMTGLCLKQAATATQSGSVWTSRNSEMVSVGRMQTLLTQTFTLDLSPDAPRISVTNPARGGGQAFPAVIDACGPTGCSTYLSQPAC